MGEVYRAYDSQLKRHIAIKILPASTLDAPLARARLLREARSAASLNHPNICTIHEVGEIDGRASSDTRTQSAIKFLRLPGTASTSSRTSLFGANKFSEVSAQVSPDNAWIAYASNESGKNQVYLRSNQGPGRKVPVSTEGGEEPQWSRQPQEPFFRNATTNQLMSADVPSAGEPGRPHALVNLATSLCRRKAVPRSRRTGPRNEHGNRASGDALVRGITAKDPHSERDKSALSLTLPRHTAGIQKRSVGFKC
jgi:hypothetical protein